MTIQEAIEKAVDGGWNSEECAPPVGSRERFDKSKMFLDPLFWQSLGKAMGWKEYWENPDYSGEDGIIRDECYECALEQREYYWKWKWHRFIDHLAEGKDVESFFQNLIHPQE